MSKIIEGFALG